MNREFHPLHRFTNGVSLAAALADVIANDLNQAIRNNGSATLALSGGNTPKRFLTVLSKQNIDWSKVTVTLVDERWVPNTDERSNEKLLREFLLVGDAKRARFIGLYCDTNTPDLGLEQITKALPRSIDVTVLGLGLDGHTASFFPDGNNLARATDIHNKLAIIPMIASGAGEPRMTLTLPRLLESGALYLHIEGQKKFDVLNEAFDPGPEHVLPIRFFLRQYKSPLNIFWAP